MNTIDRCAREAWIVALQALLGLVTLACPLPLPAQQSGATQYAVELIVFRATTAGAAEDWNAVPPGRGFGNESTRGGTPQVGPVLPAADYRLGSVDAALRNHGRLR